MLEDGVRHWLRQLPTIRLHEESDVQELVFDRAAGRVTGVRVQPRDRAAAPQNLDVDLVVDASGRGSRSPSWLEAFGYAKPREESI